jgi:hypothetical protein
MRAGVPMTAVPRPPRRLGKRLAETLERFLGAKPRAVVGLLLLIACGFWIKQNNLFPEFVLHDPTRLLEVDSSQTTPLEVPVLPEALLRPFNSLNPGIAGLVLLLSPFWPSWRMQAFLMPAALVIFLGPSLGVRAMTLPTLRELSPYRVSLAIGALLLLLGMVFDHVAAPYYEDREDF